MMPNYVINPRLMATLFPIFASTGTVQSSTEIQDASGQPIPAWSDLLGHVGITCHIEITGGSETKATNQVYATATHEILLSGYYPQITPKMRFVDTDGNTYDILLVDQESFDTFTRLVAEIKR
jgi:head-tail adaptor